MSTLSFGVMLNCAIGCSMIEIVILAADTQIPVVGVNVYMVVAWLFNAGLQVPEIPLRELVGNGAKAPP